MGWIIWRLTRVCVCECDKVKKQYFNWNFIYNIDWNTDQSFGRLWNFCCYWCYWCYCCCCLHSMICENINENSLDISRLISFCIFEYDHTIAKLCLELKKTKTILMHKIFNLLFRYVFIQVILWWFSLILYYILWWWVFIYIFIYMCMCTCMCMCVCI